MDSTSVRAEERAAALSRHLVPSNASAAEEDADMSIHGGQVIATALCALGVRFVFTLSGGHISPILVASKAAGIRVIDVRDEASAAFAADAVSRLTGTPGVCCVTAGPGITNIITAVKNAQLAESPMLVLCGATAMILKGRGSLQDIDQHALMAPHVKWSKTLDCVGNIAETVRQAMIDVQKGVPGVVMLECPLEVLYPQPIIEMQMLGTNPPECSLFQPSSWMASLQQMYLRRHLGKVYANSPVNLTALSSSLSLPPPSQTRFYRRAPPVSAVHSAAQRLLQSASRPVLVVGSQAVHPSTVEITVKALSSLPCPIFLSGMARGLLGRDHPLLCRHKRTQALKKADFVLIAGVGTDFRLEYGRQINKDAFLVMANLSSDTLTRNSDIRRRQLSACGDVTLFLLQFAERLEASRNHTKMVSRCKDWLTECRARNHARQEEIDTMAQRPSGKQGLNPLRVCSMINDVMEDDSIVVADGGDFVGTASYIVHPRRPLSWLDPGVFGTLGVGGGFALAAKAVRPSAEVWLIWGDGSSAYSLAEMDTCLRHSLPVIAVIGNDAAWQQIRRDQVRVFGDGVACELRPETRYDVAASGYGAEGILVHSDAELKEALHRAKHIVREEKRPVVLNCILSKSKFREGSISI